MMLSNAKYGKKAGRASVKTLLSELEPDLHASTAESDVTEFAIPRYEELKFLSTEELYRAH